MVTDGPAPPPAWYEADDLAGFEAWCRALVSRGVKDRRSPFHTPSLATVDEAGRPDIRTLVLRGFEPVKMTLRFHTDRRAAKVAQLAGRPEVAVHFYDAARKLQLRCAGRAVVPPEPDGRTDAAWEATQSFSRECYRVEPPPGSRLAAGGGYAWPDRTDEGRKNFAVLLVELHRVEALYLAHQGHRRATFGAERTWLVP